MSDYVLYIDDEESNRIVFESSFGKRYSVVSVSSGAEALEFLKTNPVAVVVTDQRMPHMTGEQLLEKVRDLYPATVRIIMTAYSDVDPILQAVNRGLVMRYFVKPWDRKELDEILRWSLETFARGKEDSALQLRVVQMERLATLGSMSAAMLHDLKRPISHFVTNTRRLKTLLASQAALQTLVAKHAATLPAADRENLTCLAEELTEIVDEYSVSCDLMMGLTERLQRFYRPQGQDVAQDSDTSGLIQFAMSVCREAAALNRGRVKYVGPKKLPHVAMDSIELSQVLINLIANAAEALRGKNDGLVTIDGRVQGDAVVLEIGDNGVGMTPETLAKVGKPFFSTRSEGTGLGVSQCQRLVGKANGTFALQSELGQGTRVTITLPMTPSKNGAAAP